MGLAYQQWDVAAAYIDIDNDFVDEEVKDSDMFQLSGGYSFTNGLYLGVGWQRADDEGRELDRIGLMLDYEIEF